MCRRTSFLRKDTYLSIGGLNGIMSTTDFPMVQEREIVLFNTIEKKEIKQDWQNVTPTEYR